MVGSEEGFVGVDSELIVAAEEHFAVEQDPELAEAGPGLGLSALFD